MSKVVHKPFIKTLAVAADQVVGVVDCTNCNGFSAQINGNATTAGSMKLQRSNDNTNWEDVPTATATLAVNAAKLINIADVYWAHTRILVTLSAGAGSYTITALAKER